MGIMRYRPEEIVTKLREVEVLVGQGKACIDAIRQVQSTERAFCRTKRPHSALGYRPPAPETIIPMDQETVMH